MRAVSRNLAKGTKGAEISVLQQFLISQNKGSSSQALANVGTAGNFGPTTHSALAEFQANVGISSALGNFGPITRAYVSLRFSRFLVARLHAQSREYKKGPFLGAPFVLFCTAGRV